MLNHFPNSSLEDWTRPAAGSPPDFWIVGAPPPTLIYQGAGAGNFQFGALSMGLQLNLGESIAINTPAPQDLAGFDTIFSAYVCGVAGAVPVDFTFAPGGGAPNVTIQYTPVVGTWARISRPVAIPAASAAQSLTIIKTALGAVTDFLVDGVQLEKGLVLGGWKQDSMFRSIKWDFAHTGIIAAAIMAHEGSALDIFPVQYDCVIHRLRVYCGVAPTTVDTFTVTQNGAPTALAATVTNPAQIGANHLPAGVAFAAGDRLQVLMAPNAKGSAAQNIGVVVEGYRIGY